MFKDIEYVRDLEEYLEGSDVRASFIELLLKRPTKKATVYRAVRLSKRAEVGAELTVKSDYKICSCSTSPVSALYAALSYAHDSTLSPKFIAVLKIDGADIVLSHAQIKAALLKNPRARAHAVQRLEKEKEAIALTMGMRGKVLAAYKYDAGYKFQKLLGAKALPLKLES